MRKFLYATVGVVLLLVGISTSASALMVTFSDKDFLGGASWGTMTITALNANTLEIAYEAQTAGIIPSGAQVTGFAFTFVPAQTVAGAITNPINAGYSSINWSLMSSINAPNPENGDQFTPKITKLDYFMGLNNGSNGNGKGGDQNFNPPGIKAGQKDIFDLTFTADGVPDFTASGFDLGTFVALTGIRIQSLPNEINGGSLFLAGSDSPNPIPEPLPMLLFGTGLAGIGTYIRRKRGKILLS